jgi:hypothetical protein
MSLRQRWLIGTVLGVTIVTIPVVRYREVYLTERRFREVTPARFYRSGQMPADTFREKLREHRIKLVINLQDEHPDPILPSGYWDKPHIPESQICREEGVRFEFLSFAGARGLLPRNQASATHRPKVIDDFLKLCDDPANYPILIHCWAGLHRTGALVAIYRMEYEGASVADAIRELRANGYGDRKSTKANDYIYEYLFLYQPRGQKSEVKSQRTEDRGQKSEKPN